MQKKASGNGFFELNDDVLIERFDCDTVHVAGNKPRNFLIEAESLADSQDFIDLLGFINTDKFKE